MIHKWNYTEIGLLQFNDETKEMSIGNSKPQKAVDLFEGKYAEEGHYLWLVKDIMTTGPTRFFTVGCTELSTSCADPRCQEHVAHFPS